MSINFTAYTVVITIGIFFNCLHAQKKWTGNNGNAWDHPLNWEPTGIPGRSDNVILDNAFRKGDYKVILPDTAVTIHSIIIEPGTGNHIELMLPSSNVRSPAFIVSDPGDAIVLNNGGIFKNSSGLATGQSISIAGALRIKNEGCYIHNTRASHATGIVAKLSTAPGTENGVFEFNVPGGSYPVSLSNRSYGRLVLSADASDGTQTYTTSGTNVSTIRGDLQINNGVAFNMNLAKDLNINGNYLQAGGSFNLASQPKNNVVKIKGNISQAPSGIITETSSGFPVIELIGTANQQVSIAGNITNSITVRVNNSNGIRLLNHLTLPFKLELVNGKIKTAHTSLLTISGNGIIAGGSQRSFVDGPLKKIGDEDFEFPIGKQGDYAPVNIKRSAGSVTDEFVAEYFLGNPKINYGSSFQNPPILRISELEYWKIERLSGSSAVKLSISVGTYSNATALDKLIIARWDSAASSWKTEGNSASLGIATGAITSNDVSKFGVFTLGSIIESENPLPQRFIDLNAAIINQKIRLNWKTAADAPAGYFVMEGSLDGRNFQGFGKMDAVGSVRQYSFECPDNWPQFRYIRVQLIPTSGAPVYSNTVYLALREQALEIISLLPTLVCNETVLKVVAKETERVQVSISDLYGRTTRSQKEFMKAGMNTIIVGVAGLKKGVYILSLFNAKGSIASIRFMKE